VRYFGAYFGGSEPDPVAESPIAAVEVPTTYADDVEIDHVTLALDRLCEQFRS
jgi:hypothetical protein